MQKVFSAPLPGFLRYGLLYLAAGIIFIPNTHGPYGQSLLDTLEENDKLKEEAPNIPYSAYELMEIVSKNLEYPFGLTKIQFTITSKLGNVTSYKVSLYHKERNSLLTFDSISKGRLIKILINDNGQNVYMYDQMTKMLYHKRSMDKFEKILFSGFSFHDIANLPFLNNYTPRIAGYDQIGEKRLLKVENIPLDRGSYSRLDVFVDPEKNYRVVRIDYYDKNGTLWKNMNVIYKDLPVKTQDGEEISKDHAAQLEMADLAAGTITYFEMLLNDKNIRIDNSLFDRQNIEK